MSWCSIRATGPRVYIAVVAVVLFLLTAGAVMLAWQLGLLS